MPGNWRSGRTKPTVSFSASLDRPYEPPTKPSDLDVDGEFLWATFVAPLIARRIVEVGDTAILWGLCELYSMFRQSSSKAKLDPQNRDARIAVNAYWRSFSNTVATFGANRAQRKKLEPKSMGPVVGIKPRDRRSVAGRIGEGN